MNIKALYIIFGILVLAAGAAVVSKYAVNTEVSNENKYSDLIRVDAPIVNATISSPLVVSGSARGAWYFEASFPVRLLDANGMELVSAPAQAQGDWMTENFVPFSVTLNFIKPITKTGILILKNDNPSGLSENDKEVRIPVQFSEYKEVGFSEFGKEVFLNVGGRVSYPGGLSVALVKINDSRCMKGVVCVWAGELSAVLSVDNSILSMMAREISVGTATNKSVRVGNYTFSLAGATENSATIIVSSGPSPVSTGSGSVVGYVHLGPTCPVEKFPPDPGCADRPYVNAKVEFLPKTGGVSVNSVFTDNMGRFETKLGAGEYMTTIYQKTTLSLPSCPTVEFSIRADQDTRIEISCDTGIR